MKKSIKTVTVSSWSKESFDKDLEFELTLIDPEDLIDIKYSTNIDAKDQIAYSALIIYKV